ncbi:TPA: hypothetical protein ACG3NL_001754 [Legionella pneumophila]|nr:hypothetical protein [Legionella taurinensis]
MKYRLFLSIATASVLGSTAFAGTMGPVVPWGLGSNGTANRLKDY